jgi:hypothetical protein
MTIMGALSAFAIASVALVANVFAGELKLGGITEKLWSHSALLVVSGGAAQLLAGLFFYLQRSNLAWMYGEICLTLVPGGHPSGVTTRSAIVNADSWSTWIPYRIAFAWLCLGYLFYGSAVGNELAPKGWLHVSVWAAALPFVVVLVGSVIEWRVLSVFEYEDDPWHQAHLNPRKLFRRRGMEQRATGGQLKGGQMRAAFNIIMRIVSSLLGIVMIAIGIVWILQGLNLGFRVGFMVGDKHWVLYGAILALFGIGQVIWSNMRQVMA